MQIYPKKTDSGKEHVMVIEDDDHYEPFIIMAEVNLKLLKNFKEKSSGHPGKLDERMIGTPDGELRWENILNQMIEAFEIILRDEDRCDRSEADQCRVIIGLRYYSQWFEHLWD